MIKKDFVERKRETGVFLSVLGFGEGNLNDSMMQELAQNGNGTAAYIDNLNEARKVLVEELSSTLLTIANDAHLMADQPWIAESIALRNVYTDPLNVLQAELLQRSRAQEARGEEADPRVEQALMVTIAGVAAGMRNTG